MLKKYNSLNLHLLIEVTRLPHTSKKLALAILMILQLLFKAVNHQLLH